LDVPGYPPGQNPISILLVRASGGQALVVGTHLAKRHHPAYLVEAAVEAFGGLDFLLFMARAPAPPLASLDVDAWERSVDVNLKGFIYCLAAALPAMREGGGGHVLVLGVEDPASPDPLYRASRAAVRVLLEELTGEPSDEGLRASELTVLDPASPERCAGAVLYALSESSGGFSSDVV
jgi:NAD(P)-dependent dehydrogenase (short-subunit alcohol dehydrogenase family)